MKRACPNLALSISVHLSFIYLEVRWYSGLVLECKRDHYGGLIECWSDNLIIDTHLYDIKLPDSKGNFIDYEC